MAERLDSFEFRKSASPGTALDYSKYMDGDIWRLTPVDWGDRSIKTVAHQVRKAAEKMGLKVRVSVNEKENILTLSAYQTDAPSDQEQGESETQTEQGQTEQQGKGQQEQPPELEEEQPKRKKGKKQS